jgi:DNA ligase-associated metallophosphoesterase
VADVRAELAGERVLLLPERALFRPATGELLVADAHWGKAATFRAAGIAVPGGTTGEGLARLDAALGRTGASALVFLGDLFHARRAQSPEVLAEVRAWRARHPELRVALVRGNHDRGAGDPPADLGFAAADPPLPAPPFVYDHHPEPHPDGYVLAGHLHPAAVLRGPGGMRERLPCFHFGAAVGVLPAFGAFTGNATVAPRRGEQVWVVAGDEVLRVG